MKWLLALLVLIACSAQNCAPSMPADNPSDGATDEMTDDTDDGASNESENEGNDTSKEDEGDDSNGNTDDDDLIGDGPTDPDQEPVCFTGTFACTVGPNTITCGVWQLEVNENNAVTGLGSIDNSLNGDTADLTLGGLYSPSNATLAVDLISANGSGSMFIENIDPTASISGPFDYTHNPGPDGVQLSGFADADPCGS